MMDCICESCARKDCSDRRKEDDLQIVISCNFYLKYNPTFADRIRAMSDEELADTFFRIIYCAGDPANWFCKGKKECEDLMDADKDIPDEMCKACLLAKLRQPAEEAQRPLWYEDKQYSGLLEED